MPQHCNDFRLDLAALREDYERLRGRGKPRVPKVMPFGAHKGKPFYRIPIGYLEWMWDTMKLDGGLREAVEAAINKKRR